MIKLIGEESEASNTAGEGKEQNPARFLRGLGYATFISCWDQLLAGLSCLRPVVETVAPGLVDTGTVMGLLWTLDWGPIASAYGRETTRVAGKQPWEERQQCSSWLLQSSWKDQLRARPWIHQDPAWLMCFEVSQSAAHPGLQDPPGTPRQL